MEWFLPGFKAGGPIQSCFNLSQVLNKDYDIYILTTDTDHTESQPYLNVVVNQWFKHAEWSVYIYYLKKSAISLKQIRTILRQITADYIYLNLLFSPYFSLFPLYLKYCGATNASIILAPRGTLYPSALHVKWRYKKPLLYLLNKIRLQQWVIFHATNTQEAMAIQQIFPLSCVRVANNLPSIKQPVFESCPKVRGQLNLVFIGRIVPIKNLLFIIDIIESVKASIHLSIIGPIEDKAYWESCCVKIKKLPSNISVQYEGAHQNGTLIKMMRPCHLFLLPTKGENFGHAIFEALLAGRPALISDQTPWLNLATANAGWDLPLQNKQAFTNAVQQAADWDQSLFNAKAFGAWQYAQQFRNNPLLLQPYYQLFS